MANKRQISLPASSPLPPRSRSQYGHSLEETQTLNRASAWSSLEAPKVSCPQPNVETPNQPVPRSQLSPSPLRQRPTSMVSLSPSRSLLTVTVNPPGSPPKCLYLPRTQVAPHSPFPIPTIPKRPRSYYATSGHSQFREPKDIFRSGKNSNVQHLASEQNSVSAPSKNTTKNAPPPVNRAEKPKIPVMPTSGFRSSNLELETMIIDERLSPFSTPPSSDEDPDLLSFKDIQFQSRQPERNIDRRQKQSYFHPSSTHHSILPRPCEKLSTSTQTHKTIQYRANGSPSSVSTPSDQLEARPWLPPRLNIERVSQRSTVPGAAMSKVDLRDYDDIAITRTPTSDAMTSHASKDIIKPTSEFLPPPRRNAAFGSSPSSNAGSNALLQSARPPPVTRKHTDVTKTELRAPELRSSPVKLTGFPDAASGNRRPPFPKKGAREINTHYETRLLDVCGAHACTSGYLTRAWDLLSGELVMSLGHLEKEIRVTAMAFKPGVTADKEGLRLWLGNNYGDLQEVDISTQSVVRTKSSAHGGREIVKIYRHQNSMWTLDEDGKLYVWPPDEKGISNLHSTPSSYRVPKGHTFSLIVKDTLWLATGKDIRIFRPNSLMDTKFPVLDHSLGQPGVGEVTSGATVSGQLNRVYFGHADGKVTIYSSEDYSCLGVIHLSVYKISSLAGAGDYLWAGYNTGMIYVYDTRTQPWTTKKDWLAHENPIVNILVDSSSVWNSGVIRVVSIGHDNAIRFWDGLLEDDWLGMSTVIIRSI